MVTCTSWYSALITRSPSSSTCTNFFALGETPTRDTDNLQDIPYRLVNRKQLQDPSCKLLRQRQFTSLRQILTYETGKQKQFIRQYRTTRNETQWTLNTHATKRKSAKSGQVLLTVLIRPHLGYVAALQEAYNTILLFTKKVQGNYLGLIFGVPGSKCHSTCMRQDLVRHIHLIPIRQYLVVCKITMFLLDDFNPFILGQVSWHDFATLHHF